MVNHIGWSDFVEFAQANNIGLEHEVDWMPWWECWVDGFEKGRNAGRSDW